MKDKNAIGMQCNAICVVNI